MYHCFLPLKSQFLGVMIHPEADRKRNTDLAKKKQEMEYKITHLLVTLVQMPKKSR
uniref:Pco129304b n=1 Tax=Arundo donax TaxID=35708 RepID=A0A0A9ES65_ARUDO